MTSLWGGGEQVPLVVLLLPGATMGMAGRSRADRLLLSGC